MQIFISQLVTQFSRILTEYLERNPKLGYIRFKVLESSPTNDLIPIHNAIVTINKYIGEGYYVSKVVFTDSNGETEAIPFFTVDKSLSMIPGYYQPYETYNARIENSNHITTDIFNIEVFDGITQTQTIHLSPIK